MSMKMASRVLLCLSAVGVAACSGANSQGSGGEGGAGEGGAGEGGSGGNGGNGGMSSSSSSSGNGGNGGGASSSSGGGSDPYDAARQACVDTINAHRATMGLPPFARWKEAEPCVDQQATWDQENNKAHGSWGMNLYPTCNGSGQNECLGHGAENVSGCLDGMWAERDQTGCSGCDACNEGYNPNCPNCDFYGQATGDVCGHYVNMSAKYFSKVACGFSAAGGWIAINFQ